MSSYVILLTTHPIDIEDEIRGMAAEKSGQHSGLDNKTLPSENDE